MWRWGEGGLSKKHLKGGWNKTEGRGHKDFKNRCKLGQGVGALKRGRGSWDPLKNYVVWGLFQYQHSNVSSKAVNKIIAEAEAKKIIICLGSASANFLPMCWNKSLYLPSHFLWQSSEVTSTMLFYLINHYETIINC